MNFGAVKKYRDHIFQIGSLGLNLLFIMVAAYVLPIEDFGRFTFEYAFSSVLAVVFKFGLDSLFLFYFPRVGYYFAARVICIFSLILFPVFILICLNIEIISYPLALLSVVMALDEILLAVQRSQQKAIQFLAARNALYSLRIIVLILFQDLPILILCAVTQGVSVVVFMLLNGVKFKQNYYEKEKWSDHAHEISLWSGFKFTLKNVMSNLLGVLTVKIDIFMLAALAGFGLVGYYEIGARWGFLASIPITIISAVNAPRISKLGARSTLSFFEIFYQRSRKQTFSVTVSYVLVLVIAQQLFGKYAGLFDAELLDVGVILGLGFAISSFFGPSGTALVLLGYPGLHLLRVGIALMVNIALNLIMIPTYGSIGAALSTAIVVAMSSVVSYFALLKVMRKKVT